MEIEFSGQILEKYSKIRFHENTFSGSPAVPCVRTDGQTDVIKLTIAFLNFARAPNK
jgi:hypothetical protein